MSDGRKPTRREGEKRPNPLAPLVKALRARTGLRYVAAAEAMSEVLGWDFDINQFHHLFRRPDFPGVKRFDPAVVAALVGAYTASGDIPRPNGCTVAEAVEIFRHANLAAEEYARLEVFFGAEAVAFARQRAGGRVGLMPPFPPHDVWRADDLRTLVARLTAPDGAVIGVYGLHGMGKSTLIAHLLHAHAHELAQSFPDGIVWASLGEGSDLALVFQRWLRELGGAVQGDDLTSAAYALRYLCAGRRVLLVVEDLSTPEQYEALNGLRTAGMSVLMTSHLPSVLRRLRQEDRFPLAPLPTAQVASLLADFAPDLDLSALAASLGGIPRLITEVATQLAQAKDLRLSMERVVERLTEDPGALDQCPVLEWLFGPLVRRLGAQEQAVLAAIADRWPEPVTLSTLAGWLGLTEDGAERSAWQLAGCALIEPTDGASFTVNPALANYLRRLAAHFDEWAA